MGRDPQRTDEMVYVRRRIKRGETVFRAGDDFNALYAVRGGSFKTLITTRDGGMHVTGFQIGGELLGTDGLATGAHVSSAIALEDGQVCMIPYKRLEASARAHAEVQAELHKALSREITLMHGVMLLLGTLRARERMAAFLVNFSRRLKARGLSDEEFTLHMSRADIGSFLGLTLETVSRGLSGLSRRGVLQLRAQGRSVRILDRGRLAQLAGPEDLIADVPGAPAGTPASREEASA
jgi:CRP/FNR family transcriptional regulator